jgi:hypothetical protein
MATKTKKRKTGSASASTTKTVDTTSGDAPADGTKTGIAGSAGDAADDTKIVDDAEISRAEPLSDEPPLRFHESYRCTATSKRAKRRCRRPAMKGQKVCEMHGGKTPGAKAAGLRRQAKQKALAKASRMVQAAGTDVDPIDHLLDSLHRAAQLVNVYGLMCAEIDDSQDEKLSDDKTRGELGYSVVEEEVTDGRVVSRFIVKSKDKLLTLNKHSEAQLHPYLQAYTEALRDRARFAKMAIDAGIAELQMELVERQVDMAQEALEATLAEMRFTKSDRERFMKLHARQLRDIGCRGTTVPAAQLLPGGSSR